MTDSTAPLADAAEAIVRTARLLERAADGVSLADFRVLAGIAAGHERASRLAERLALGKPAISASVDSLVRRGLVIREQVVGDSRAARLELTDAGRERFTAAQTGLAAALEPVIARTAEPANTAAVLVELGRAVERLRAEQLQGSRS